MHHFRTLSCAVGNMASFLFLYKDYPVNNMRSCDLIRLELFDGKFAVVIVFIQRRIMCKNTSMNDAPMQPGPCANWVYNMLLDIGEGSH